MGQQQRQQQLVRLLLAQRHALASRVLPATAASAASLPQWQRHYSRGKDDDSPDGKDGDKHGGLIGKLWGGRAKSKSEGKPAEESSNGEAALVLASPERKHHKLYVVELGRKPLFPGIYTPVMVNKNEKLIKEITEMKRQGVQPYVGAFLRKHDAGSGSGGLAAAAPDAAALAGELGSTVSSAADHLHEVGTFAQVHTLLTGDSPDSAQLLLLGHRRIRRKHVISTDPLRVHVEHLKDEAYANDDILKATSMEMVNTMRDLLHLNPLYGEQFRTLLSLTGSIDLQDMSRLVDAAASLTSADDQTLQQVLEQLSVPERARAVLVLLKKEVELCKLQADIREQVEGKMVKEQRRMLLMEQLKSIKRELGLEKDDKSALVQRFTERWDAKKAGASEEARRVVADELEKLSGLEPVSPEFNVTRNYLEWLTSLPWGVYSPDIFDLEHAKQVLDEDHYGLDDVKERILEFIAVSGLRGSAQGKILCLVGPPGVGKTSIGRSIARTLHRKYHRFSVGGLHDVAEIKGHRRTYVGAMPGKVVQCLKATGTSNPLLLIDEIDKLGRGHGGDPASALLELLDPEQNTGFTDHYLDVPVDLSKVLFMCTANVLDTIPGPLLDRMEVIRLSGYTADEKVAIARKYLEPQAMADSGVPANAARIADDAMESLIHEYCREAGVRNLKKQLEKIYRKIALRVFKATGPPPAPAAAEGAAAAPAQSSSAEQQGATDQAGQGSSSSSSSSSSAEAPASPPSSSDSAAGAATPPPQEQKQEQPAAPRVIYTGEVIEVTKDKLKDYVGQAPFAKDRFYDSTPPGVVMGLAWTAMGGATLYVEAAKVQDSESKGGLVTTGQLGDVFRESVSIAHTYARSYVASVDAGNKFFSTSAIHVHVPQGATPKDGPSAGCTIITALLSLALNRPVLPDTAMTGEVTLTGRVLPIGGVKEKLLAAKRAGVKQVIFPEGNRADYEELGPELKQGVTPHFVAHYDEIFKLVLPAPADAAAPAPAAA